MILTPCPYDPINGVQAFTGFGLDELFTEVAHIACGTVPLSPHTPKAVTYIMHNHITVGS